MMDSEYCVGCNEHITACKCIQVDKGAPLKLLVPEMGPQAPTAINTKGAKQSKVPFRCDLLPPLALLEVARVLNQGSEKYGDHNWRDIEKRDHINHALSHILAHQAGDQSDDHLSHAACRLLFALESR